MSDYESYTGKLIFIGQAEGETVMNQIQKFLDEKEIDYLDDIHAKQIFEDEFYNSYLIHKDSLYKIEKTKLDPYDSHCTISRNESGEIIFNTRFYNGGTCLAEMLEEGLNEFEKNESFDKMEINTSMLFNEKWSYYLEPHFYGLIINDENVIKFLDKEFEIETEENPSFKYSQIKLKFGQARVYAETTKYTKWEEKINEILDER